MNRIKISFEKRAEVYAEELPHIVYIEGKPLFTGWCIAELGEWASDCDSFNPTEYYWYHGRDWDYDGKCYRFRNAKDAVLFKLTFG